MPRANIAWKISTFAALCLAAFFAVRSFRVASKVTASPTSSASPPYGTAPGFAFVGEPIAAPEGSRAARLLGTKIRRLLAH